MTVDSRSVREPLGMVLALGLCFGTGCGGDEGDEGDEGGGDVGVTDDGADSNQQGETTDDPPDVTTTSGAADGQSADGGDDESTGSEEEVDPNLDRSAPNILDDPSLCGYPGPGQYGYGDLIDQSRFPNFVLEDCNGNQREFAEFFCHRDDIDDFNKVFIVVMEAVW